MRVDRRLSGLWFDSVVYEVFAKSCVDTLIAEVSLDLRSLLEALGTRTRHHVDQLEVPRSALLSIASLGYSD